MAEEPDLFGYDPQAFARGTDPGTSHAAAASIKPDVAALEMLVARVLMHQLPRGLICEDICTVTGLPWQTVSPRLKPLRKKGIVQLRYDPDTGRPITQVASSGRSQQVHWFVRWPDAS